MPKLLGVDPYKNELEDCQLHSVRSWTLPPVRQASASAACALTIQNDPMPPHSVISCPTCPVLEDLKYNQHSDHIPSRIPSRNQPKTEIVTVLADPSHPQDAAS